MRKSCKMAMILLTSAVISGCSAISAGNKSDQMDFSQEMIWQAPDPAPGLRPRILFVGNSHTYYNNLSAMFVNIVSTLGHESSVHELSNGYYTLKKYADMEDTGGALLDKTLAGKKWDFVILQENTTMALSESAEEEMFPPARTLDEKIRAAGGQTAFLMTWAPKDGMKVGFKKKKRESVQSDLASNYMTIAAELNSLVIPAGIAFMRCSKKYPEIELWDSDGQHPSSEGSYLTACTIYAVIYQESPENCPYFADLDPQDAMKLQQVAAELVFN